MVCNAAGKKIETICHFGIAPGEAEVIDARKAGSIQSPNDLQGKNLGVTELGSGTHTLTLAILGKAGIDPTKEHFVAVAAPPPTDPAPHHPHTPPPQPLTHHTAT